MSCNSDLEWQKREIAALVDDINAIERSLALPKLDGFDDFDRLEALDIVNRIERKLLASSAKPGQAA